MNTNQPGDGVTLGRARGHTKNPPSANTSVPVTYGSLRPQAATRTNPHAVVDLFVDLVVGRVLDEIHSNDGGGSWLTLRAAADYAACSPDTIRRAALDGTLRGGRIGKSDFRFRRVDVDAWLLGHRPAGSAKESVCDGPSPEARDILAAMHGGT